jgi:hypothetical protein
MRLKVHQLRIALIVVNLVLAGSAAAYAFTRYYNLSDKKRESVKIIDPKTLVMKLDDLRQGESAAGKLTMVSSILRPKPPEIATPGGEEGGDSSSKEPEGPTAGEEPLGPGPLGDHWEYAFFILLDDPLNNLVILRKKEAAGAAPGPAANASKQAGARPRSTLRPQRVVNRGGKAAGVVQAAGDSLTFTVGQRWYKNEAVDPPVDIYVHSADAKEVVYWVSNEPKKMYALPRASHSFYYEEPEKGLRPPPKAEGEEEEKAKGHFILRPSGWEDKKEEEYQRMLQGEPPGPNMKLTGPQELEKSEKETATPSKKVPSFGKSQEPRKTFTDEEKDQLREVMKSPKMSDKDRAELRKALMGGKK